VSALRGCRLLFPFLKIFACVYFWSSTGDAACFITWCGIVCWTYPLKSMLKLLGFFLPHLPHPHGSTALRMPRPLLEDFLITKFVHNFMFFVLCIVMQLCNACTNGLPDGEHMMFKTCRRHEELNLKN